MNTGYKLLTAVISVELHRHVDERDIFPAEQKALRRRQRGCLDALAVDFMLASAKRLNLSVAWVDYKKAYDRVPHDWLLHVLDTIRVPAPLRQCIARLLPRWRLQFELGRGRNAVKVNLVFRHGLFQGNSLSPLLYCLSIVPLSHALRRTKGVGCGTVGNRVTHSFFMNDLKVYATGERALKVALSTVDRISQAVGMELGLKKCGMAHVRRGKLVDGGPAALDDGREIPAVNKGNPYKYLGIEQAFEPDQMAVKARLFKEYLSRLKRIWFSDLNAKHKVQASNVWAVSVYHYYFGLLRWSGPFVVFAGPSRRRSATHCRFAIRSTSLSTRRSTTHQMFKVSTASYIATPVIGSDIIQVR